MTVFNVLHYGNPNITVKCVNSLLNLEGEYHIIIVCNSTSNRLMLEYSTESKVTIIQNEKNLGFAKGHNVGYRFAKYRLKADYIVLLNNDVIITDPETLAIIEDYYMEEYEIGYTEVFATLLTSKFRIILAIMKWWFEIITNMEVKIKKSKKGEFIPHGSFLVFQPSYIKTFEGIYQGTFMYMEEHIFYFMVRKLRLRWNYLPIAHQHKGGTKDKKQLIKSAKVYLKVLKGG